MKIIKSLIIVSIAFMLNACSSKNPSDKLIKEDLIEVLKNKYPTLMYDSYSVIQSKTEDDVYEATIDLVATNLETDNYKVEINIPLDIRYEKYDQGWTVDRTEFSDNITYSVEKAPSIEYLQKLKVGKYGDKHYFNNKLDDLLDIEVQDNKIITHSKTNVNISL